ncbi:MAG: alginate export family protein [Vicinamibacterales bacterium]
MTATIANVTRVESWSYFQPRIDPLALTPEPVGDPDYTFIADRAELGVRVEGRRFDLSGAFNYVRLENLPTDAIGPGGFGSGAFYFAATGVSYSYQLYLGELTLRVKSADNRQSLTIGRMPFSSGEVRLRPDSQHSAAYGETIARLTQERVASRLIGDFEWSLYQRRFDGARVDAARGRWHFTAGAFMPTQGGYEESTNLTITRIQVGAASAAYAADGSETEAFLYAYRDRRRGPMAVVDNQLIDDRRPDITIASIGGSHARVVATGAGELDAVAWGAGQLGDWYGTPHRAASFAVEAGHRWTRARWRPWLRAGYLWASGDGSWDDDSHNTFFQMLPSSRKYALSSAYAQMNLRDAFAQAVIEPRGFNARIEVHRLTLASGADLWYQGSGATASADRYFGFAGRHAQGETSLGTVLEGTIDVPLKKYWSVNAYAGTMWGGGVVRRYFTDKRLTFWSLENVIRF